jgi:hypothetical protein
MSKHVKQEIPSLSAVLKIYKQGKETGKENKEITREFINSTFFLSQIRKCIIGMTISTIV